MARIDQTHTSRELTVSEQHIISKFSSRKNNSQVVCTLITVKVEVLLELVNGPIKLRNHLDVTTVKSDEERD